MKCLVTGAGGFVGGHLVEHLVREGQEVCTVDTTCSPLLNALQDKVKYVAADVGDKKGMIDVLGAFEPEVIYHLAAQSYPNLSWQEPAFTFEVNVLGTVHLLDAVRAAEVDPVIVLACSSGEYAVSRDGRPITESDALDPSSPYAVSKLVMDHLGRLYAERYNLRIIRARPFFLVGPRKKGDVCSDFARGIVAIERGEREDLPVGTLDVERDMMDVRDGVAALWLLARQGEPGEVYNICSGQGYSIGGILERFKAMARTEVRAREDESLVRPVEEKVKVGDPAKLRALGWSPQFALDDTLKDILEYWREEGME